jgi:hypothetical protein
MFAQLVELLDTALTGVAVARRFVAFWGPVQEVPSLLAPVLAIASVLALALMSGVAVGALATAIVALLVLYLLLTEVFGVSIDVAVP